MVIMIALKLPLSKFVRSPSTVLWHRYRYQAAGGMITPREYEIICYEFGHIDPSLSFEVLGERSTAAPTMPQRMWQVTAYSLAVQSVPFSLIAGIPSDRRKIRLK